MAKSCGATQPGADRVSYPLARRRTAWQARPAHYTRGTMAKYAAQVSSASRGAVTG